jgi:peptidoglycan/LPS O-acetylase OafA/YrhL
MYKSIEILRIVSAVLVVTAHLPSTTLPVFSMFCGGDVFLGSIGVDVFFVISGIVMGMTYDKRKKIDSLPLRVRGFLTARILRIYPLYVVTTIIAIVIAPLFGRAIPRYERIIKDLLLVPHMDNGVYVDPIIGVGWTLRFEIAFYLLVFLSLVFRMRQLASIVIIALVSLSMWVPNYYGCPLLLEFLAGYMLAGKVAIVQMRWGKHIRIIGLICAVSIFFFAALGTDVPPSKDTVNIIPRTVIYFKDCSFPRVIVWGLPALLVVFAAVALEEYIPQCLAKCGKYTYSVYLMQYFCLPVFDKMRVRGLSDVIALSSTVSVLCLMSVVSYKMIEKPALLIAKRVNE